MSDPGRASSSGVPGDGDPDRDDRTPRDSTRPDSRTADPGGHPAGQALSAGDRPSSQGEVGAVVEGGLRPPDHPDDPDLPENRGRRAAEEPAPPRKAHHRTTLNRAVIVAAGIDFVDAHGLPALTMRRLAGSLGVEAMALYNYVSGREDLLDAIVETVVDELFHDPDVYLEPRRGWQDHLHRLAHGVRRIALAHPALFPLVATRPPQAPWVRPPLRSLRWVESFLSALRTHGFDRDQTVVAYRAYTSFLLGHLLLEVAQRGVAINAIDDPDGDRTSTPDELPDFPLIQDLQDRLALDETVTEFEQSLENLLNRLETMVATDTAHL